MPFTKFLNTIKDYSHEVDDLQTVNALVNSAFKDWIASKGIGQVVVLENGKIIINIILLIQLADFKSDRLSKLHISK